MTFDLSIIIVSFNARDDLARCLQSLHDAPPSRAHEIIVDDNASTDGSADESRRWTGLRVIGVGRDLWVVGGNDVNRRASRVSDV